MANVKLGFNSIDLLKHSIASRYLPKPFKALPLLL